MGVILPIPTFLQIPVVNRESQQGFTFLSVRSHLPISSRGCGFFVEWRGQKNLYAFVSFSRNLRMFLSTFFILQSSFFGIFLLRQNVFLRFCFFNVNGLKVAFRNDMFVIIKQWLFKKGRSPFKHTTFQQRYELGPFGSDNVISSICETRLKSALESTVHASYFSDYFICASILSFTSGPWWRLFINLAFVYATPLTLLRNAAIGQ